MMSIRARLVFICLVAAMLPALPLSLVVESLIDRSFSVGLNDTTEDALRSGIAVSREHFDAVVAQFKRDVRTLTVHLRPQDADSTVALGMRVRVRQTGMRISGIVAADQDTRQSAPSRVTHPHPGRLSATPRPALPAGLKAFSRRTQFARISAHHTWEVIAGGTSDAPESSTTFYAASDRSMLLASWRGALLFYHQIDPFFARQAHSLLAARQLFARLRLTRGRLTRSFFYTFSIIYAACVLIALAVALWMAERLANPVRALARGADAVAGGDWSVRVHAHAGGETGRLVAAFNDMVEQLNVQRRRIAETERLAAWRDVARHLAHEIKNPLLPIRLTIEELRDQYPGGSDAYSTMLAESTRVVGEELDHLHTLVREFSAFARLPKLKPASADLGALARDVATIYSATSCDVLDAGVRPFRFDADAIRSVLINFFDNAVAVGASRITIALREEKERVVLTFADNGPGVPKDHLVRVFEPYFTTRETGTGIGLAMSRNIVIAHGGNISASTAEEGGAVFTVSLPLHPPPDDASSASPHSITRST